MAQERLPQHYLTGKGRKSNFLNQALLLSLSVLVTNLTSQLDMNYKISKDLCDRRTTNWCSNNTCDYKLACTQTFYFLFALFKNIGELASEASARTKYKERL